MNKNLTGNNSEKKKEKWHSLANEEFFKQNSSFQSLSDDFKCVHIFVELFNNI